MLDRRRLVPIPPEPGRHDGRIEMTRGANSDLPPVAMPHVRAHPVLNGQKALVTGASSGIGKATVTALARAGAAVAVNYLGKEDAAREIVARIESGGGTAV